MTRGPPPQGGGGGLQNHDHSNPDDEGGDYLNPARMDVRDSRLADSRGEGFVGIGEVVADLEENTFTPTGVESANSVAVAGNVAYVATGTDIFSLDITDPLAPREIGSINTSGEWVEIQGPILYTGTSTPESVIAIDVSDPTDLSNAVAETGNMGGGGDVVGQTLYAVGNGGLATYDISDPLNSIPERGSVDPGVDLNAVQKAGSYAFAVAGSAGQLEVFDVRDPADPQVAATLSDPFASNGPLDLAVRRDRLYVADGANNEFLTIDITDPESPSVLGRESDAGYNGAASITVRGDYAYVGVLSGIVVVDLRDPANPAAIAFYTLSAGPNDMEIRNGLILAGAGDGLLLSFGADVTGSAGVLDSGTVTASGGSTPAVDTTIAGVVSGQTTMFDVNVGVDSDPTFSADYAFNYDWGAFWDDSDSEWDVDLTINWDTDPGASNDVTMRWEVVRP